MIINLPEKRRRNTMNIRYRQYFQKIFEYNPTERGRNELHFQNREKSGQHRKGV